MRRLFLHAGQPKTGTSAIQSFLAAKRAELMGFGFHYPEAGYGMGGGHRALVYDVLGRPIPRSRQGCSERAKQELMSSPVKDAIVSSEFLYGFSALRGTDNVVTRFFRDSGFEVTFFLYVRDPVELCDSGYSQVVKSYAKPIPLDKFASSFMKSYSNGLDRYSKHLEDPNVRFVARPYTRAVRAMGVAADFLSTIGVAREQIESLGPEDRKNTGVGPLETAISLELVHRLNVRSPPLNRGQVGAVRRRVREIIRAGGPEPTFRGLDAAQAEEVERRTAESRERFAQAAWGSPWGDHFPSQDGERTSNRFDPRTAEPHTLERYERTLAAALEAARAVMSDPAFGRIGTPRTREAVGPGKRTVPPRPAAEG